MAADVTRSKCVSNAFERMRHREGMVSGTWRKGKLEKTQSRSGGKARPVELRREWENTGRAQRELMTAFTPMVPVTGWRKH